MKRCHWVDENSPIYIQYHDEEWGIPKYDDKELFELLSSDDSIMYNEDDFLCIENIGMRMKIRPIN